MKHTEAFSLVNKTVVVTGAAGILGKEFCVGLAQHGANIALVDINVHEATQHAQFIENEYKVHAKAYACDVTMPDSVTMMVKNVVEDFGEINVLHNNAAGKSENLKDFFTPFEEFSLKTWNDIMSINVSGMFLAAQAVGNQMILQKKGGSIIQTASIYGIVAPDQRIYENSNYLGMPINTPAVYSASKAAVIGLTKYLAAYWANKGIRVNSITPGGVESGQNNTFIENYSKRTPLNRMATKEEMVGALIYLASEASSYVTGQNIVVDGGLTVW